MGKKFRLLSSGKKKSTKLVNAKSSENGYHSTIAVSSTQPLSQAEMKSPEEDNRNEYPVTKENLKAQNESMNKLKELAQAATTTKLRNDFNTDSQIRNGNFFVRSNDEETVEASIYSRRTSYSYSQSDTTSSFSDDAEDLETMRALMIEASSSSMLGENETRNLFDFSSFACMERNQKINGSGHNDSLRGKGDNNNVVAANDKFAGSDYWKGMFQCGPDKDMDTIWSMDSHDLKLESQETSFSFTKYVDGKVDFMPVTQKQDDTSNELTKPQTQSSKTDNHESNNENKTYPKQPLEEQHEKELEAATKKDIEISNTEELSCNPLSISTSRGKNPDNTHKSKLSSSRSSLSRPFGRTSLPASLTKKWIVEISPLDKNDSTYSVSVYKDEMVDGKVKMCLSSTSSTTSLFHAEAYTVRRLQDFLWLEESLREEFHGSLAVPMLSIAITYSGPLENMTTQKQFFNSYDFYRGLWDPALVSSPYDNNQIDHSIVLSQWLSDILNGIRGKGELLLQLPIKEDTIIRSESMETFLYKNIDYSKRTGQLSSISLSSASLLGISHNGDYYGGDNTSNAPDVNQLIKKIVASSLQCFSPNGQANSSTLPKKPLGDFVSCKAKSNNEVTPELTSDLIDKDPIQQRIENFVNRNITNDHQELSSYYYHPNHNPAVASLAQHSESLNAKLCLLLSHREVTLRSMYRLRLLLDQEIIVGAAWKRFAISLSNLFSIEKSIEDVRLSDQPKVSVKGPSPSKNMIDDGLRILARQKVDRSVPSLKVLSAMLNAYFSDLSSIPISLEAFIDELEKKKDIDSNPTEQNCLNQNANLAMSMQKYLTANLMKVRDTCNGEVPAHLEESRKYQKITQFRQNQHILKVTMQQFCMAVPIRTSRMSWKFFKMEAGQAGLLRSAAASFSSALLEDPESKERKKMHRRDEESDNIEELALIQKILSISKTKKYKMNPLISSSTTMGSDSSRALDTNVENKMFDHGYTEIDEVEDDINSSPLALKAYELARMFVGRWDAKVAQAIMEALGIQDSEIRIEETTRDIRVVRKLATGLRETLDRCKDALEMLNQVVSPILSLSPETAKANGITSASNLGVDQVQKVREDFLSQLSLVLSGTYHPLDEQSHSTITPLINKLSTLGIDVSDVRGWLSHKQANNSDLTKNKCGELAHKYFLKRDKGLSFLLKKFKSIVKDYERRVKEIEGYVYMNCVGIQLEKHFSKIRADELAAWEKKTNVSSAINVAKKKRLHNLVDELQANLSSIETVSHTSVKEAKDKHLASKTLKVELQALATKRLKRLREKATNKIMRLIKSWVKYEETIAKSEMKTLREVVREIEKSISQEEIEGDGGSHLFAITKNTR